MTTRLIYISTLLLSTLTSVTSQLVGGHIERNVLEPRRTSSILINHPALPRLPDPHQRQFAPGTASLNLDDIQGDILSGMSKKMELFFFFGIEDAAEFKSKLGSDIVPLVTTTTQLLSVSTQPITALNIAFSQSGLLKLDIRDFDGSSSFGKGQAADADALGDPGSDNWVNAFKGTSIHGVMLLASDSVDNIHTELARIQSIFGASISEKHRLQGATRPGSEEGHEHFGFMDGISQPAVKGFHNFPHPGQSVVEPRIILVNETEGNTGIPAWAQDGSFLAFRQLKQLVPEFNKFLADNPIVEPGVLSPEQGSALLAARMIGRWKSGAPIDLTPLADDPKLGADRQRNNNFTFAHPNEDLASNQTRCPFSSHIRKTHPRADLSDAIHHIVRAGIPYGPEVTEEEAASNTTTTERGLAFVSYQSDLDQGFRFMQRNWANNKGFPFGKIDKSPGVDPIIGALGGAPRVISGLDPTNATTDMTLVTDFVVSRGGEYFFCPSISAIKETLAVPSQFESALTLQSWISQYIMRWTVFARI